MSTISTGVDLPNSHDQFEYLCALEASDQISPEERKALQEHLQTCADCRQVLTEYCTLSEVLTERSNDYAKTDLPPGMYARFRTRAFNQDIRLEPNTVQASGRAILSSWWRTVAAWSAAAAMALLILVLIIRHPLPVHENQPTKTKPAPTTVQTADADLALRNELRRVQAKQKEVEVQLQQQERALKAAQNNEAALNSRIATLKAESDSASSRELQAKGDVQRLEYELAQAKSDKNAAQNEVVIRLAEVTDLRKRLASLDAELSRERRLNASLDEMRDLMENRDVRVIRLGSVNQGKEVRAFGKAFYVPGQKLVLFVYDLSDPKSLTAHSFYVWGDKPGTDQPVLALGKLTLENQKDDRWGIRIQNPDLFARINEVFITMESNKREVKKPEGQPMLVTSLTNDYP